MQFPVVVNLRCIIVVEYESIRIMCVEEGRT